MICPCCKQPLPETGFSLDPHLKLVFRNARAVQLSRNQWKLFAKIHDGFVRKYDVGMEMLFATLYADDPDGGPDSVNVISVQLKNTRTKLEPLGINIKSRSGPGAIYTLEFNDVV